MGIEQNIERVANAMERIANNLDRLVVCADFHLERAQMMDASKGVESPKVREVMAQAEVTVEPETPAPAAEPKFTYEELKAKLIERGVEIPKGTKMTTLLKLWAANSDKPVIPPAPEVVEAEVVEPTVVDEAPAEIDPFDLPAEPAKPAIPDDLPLEEARELIMNKYDRSPEDKKCLIAAFAEVGSGISTFAGIPQGKHGVVARKFLELKGVEL